MATYTAIISTEGDLLENWSDANTPNFSFSYNEVELSECTENADGTYTATYDTLELSSSREYTYIHSTNGETTYTLSAGEYGIKPS